MPLGITDKEQMAAKPHRLVVEHRTKNAAGDSTSARLTGRRSRRMPPWPGEGVAAKGAQLVKHQVGARWWDTLRLRTRRQRRRAAAQLPDQRALIRAPGAAAHPVRV